MYCEANLLKLYKILPIASILLLLASTSVDCIIIKDSPAPGCVKYFGMMPPGGCFGKSAIIDLKVEPSIEGLEIEANNCNGGVLEVTNACAESFFLGGVEVKPSEYNVSLDVVRTDSGYSLTRIHSNFSNYIPQKDELIEFVGTLGNHRVNVSYIKTKKLCD